MADSSLLILWLTLIITKFDDYTRVTITQIFDSVIYVRHRYYLENCVVRNNIDLLFIEWWDIIVDLSHHYHTLIFIPNKYPNATDIMYNTLYNINRNYAIMSASLAHLRSIRTGLLPGSNWKQYIIQQQCRVYWCTRFSSRKTQVLIRSLF